MYSATYISIKLVQIISVATYMGTDEKIAIKSSYHGKAAVNEFSSGNGCMHISSYIAT